MTTKALNPIPGVQGTVSLLFLFLLISLTTYSQDHSINLEKVSQKKVREYIELRSFDQLDDFSSIHPSWKRNTDENDFNVIEEIFYLKKKLSTVWDFYSHSDPLKMWNGRSYRLGLLICKPSGTIIYSGNPRTTRLDTGQVYFLNLRIIKGLVNVPVAFEIINIDPRHRIMELSYIDNNKSLGKQLLEFFDDGEGRTRIVHKTYFKSESWLRDKLFYPYFHFKFIEEFHSNMKQQIKHAGRGIEI